MDTTEEHLRDQIAERHRGYLKMLPEREVYEILEDTYFNEKKGNTVINLLIDEIIFREGYKYDDGFREFINEQRS